MSCIISLGINREKNIKLNTVIENPTAKTGKVPVWVTHTISYKFFAYDEIAWIG